MCSGSRMSASLMSCQLIDRRWSRRPRPSRLCSSPVLPWPPFQRSGIPYPSTSWGKMRLIKSRVVLESEIGLLIQRRQSWTSGNARSTGFSPVDRSRALKNSKVLSTPAEPPVLCGESHRIDLAQIQLISGAVTMIGIVVVLWWRGREVDASGEQQFHLAQIEPRSSIALSRPSLHTLARWHGGDDRAEL